MPGPRREWFLEVLALLKPRCKKLPEFVEAARPFLAEPDGYDPEGTRKHLATPGLREHIAALREAYTSTAFDEPALEQALRAVAEQRGIKAGALIHATRLALTGRTMSPGLFELIALLGRDAVSRRLTRLEQHLST